MDPISSYNASARDFGEAAPPGALGGAIDEFIAELKEKHQEDSKNPFLQTLITHSKVLRVDNGLSQSEVSAQELQSSLLELDARKRTGKGYRLLHRLGPFLEALKNVLRMGEALTQSAPFGISIAFAGARIVLEMALSVEEYLEVVVTAMERIAGILEVYQKLAISPDLGPRLVRSHRKIIEFWYKLSKVLSSSKPKGILPRSIFTPLKKETEEALKDLQEDMHLNLGITQAAALHRTEMDRQAMADASQDALKNDIRRWIMGRNAVDFKGDYENQFDLRHGSTCTWILRDQRFLDWCDSRDNALLWYNAQPGSGKSVLASVVIDHLARAEKKVAYFFYSFSKSTCRLVADGLRVLALQLLALVKVPSDKLVDLYQTDIQYSDYLSNLRTMVGVLHELITRNDDLYIVIDGVDECEDEKDMLNLIELLIDQPTLGTVRWLFTSRVSEIEKTMRKLQAVEVRPNPEDIQEDIRNYLSPRISCNHCLLNWTEECDNNFLIARFVSETLGKLTSEEDIMAELKIFPKKLNGYYLRTLAKIDTRSQMEQIAARRIFLILSSAQQALSIDELIDALAIRRGSLDYSPSRLPKEELIRELCGSLVIVEDHISRSNHSPIVRFCHKSVKDFFQQDPKTCDTNIDESLHKYFVAPSDANEEFGLDCLTYLTYGRYSKHIDLSFLADIIPKEHALLRYAATFWFQHLDEDLVEKPSPATVRAVREFISSKNFWNCLRVQSHVVPFLFGRYTHSRRGFKMATRGRGWKGDDGFAVPLPMWLGDHSPEDFLMDRSLCHFVQEWRQVIVAHPYGVDQCVPMKPFDNSCWLKCLSKSNTVKAVHTAEAFGSDTLTTCQLLGVCFIGKKLCIDVAYRTKSAPTDEIYRLRQPLFKASSQPQRSCQRLPVDTDISEPAICSMVPEDVTSELVAWGVDPLSLDLKRVNSEHSERIKPPSLPSNISTREHGMVWKMVAHYNGTGADAYICTDVIHMSRKADRQTRPGYDDHGSDSDGDSDGSNEFPEEDSENEQSDDADEFSDDEISSAESGDESMVEQQTTDESDVESYIGCKEETDCLILIPRGLSPFWTKPWTHPPLIWSRIVCAMHPTKPLAVYMHTPTQIEVVDLAEKTQMSFEVSGLTGEPEDVLANAQELRFSHCGNYLHCLSITFVRKNLYTECTVAHSILDFALNAGGAAEAMTASEKSRVVYNIADGLKDTDAPYALSYWCDKHIIVALPPLTCKPKILKIALDGDAPDPISTLRNPIFFPESTPQRDARLIHRPSGQDSEGYVFLVLNAVPVGKDSTPDMSSPVVALRWGVSDDDGWRPWDEQEDGNPSDLLEDSPLRSLMRGNFVESGKPFSVPIRSGLNWTRKGYLSCR